MVEPWISGLWDPLAQILDHDSAQEVDRQRSDRARTSPEAEDSKLGGESDRGRSEEKVERVSTDPFLKDGSSEAREGEVGRESCDFGVRTMSQSDEIIGSVTLTSGSNVADTVTKLASDIETGLSLSPSLPP